MSKVVVISRGWYPVVYGGSERFISRVSDELVKMGYQVVAITRLLKDQVLPRTSYQLITVRQRLALPYLASYMFSRKAAKVANKLRPNVVIVNAYWGELSPLYINKSIPVIVVIHDVGLFESEWARKHKFKHFLRVKALKRVVERAEKIVVPSVAVKEDLVRYLSIDEDKISILGFEGVDGPFKRVHNENEYFDIVQVGRFAPNKGQHITLGAFKHVMKVIPNARLWLVGGRGVDVEHVRYFERIVELADRLNREAGREVVKVVADVEDVNPYYRIADVCVFPSLGEEGYGLTVLECMAHGKPVIVSSIFARTGVASEERAYILPSLTPEHVAKAIVHIYENYGDALRKAEKGLDYARKCSWRRVAEKISTIMAELLNTR